MVMLCGTGLPMSSWCGYNVDYGCGYGVWYRIIIKMINYRCRVGVVVVCGTYQLVWRGVQLVQRVVQWVCMVQWVCICGTVGVYDTVGVYIWYSGCVW